MTRCKECFASKRKEKREQYNLYQKEWAKQNPEKRRLYKRSCRRKNPYKYRQSEKEYLDKNREKHNVGVRLRYRNNPNPFKIWSRLRDRRIRQATPSWMTKEHNDKIREVYSSARTRSDFHETPFHVDHIEPLKGINDTGEHIACGLHVWWNLQVLTGEENLKKSNKINQPKN